MNLVHYSFIFLFTAEWLAVLSSGNTQNQLSYEEIVSLNASCHPSDSCVGMKNDTGSFANRCDCDKYCVKYGTCCIDSSYISSMKNSRRSIQRESCLRITNSHYSIFGVNKCKRNWKGHPEVKSLCETEEKLTKLEDPLAVLPVTNPVTEITYKNYFCAQCNDIKESDLVFWSVLIQSQNNISKSALLEQLVYDASRNQWGIQNDDVSGMGFDSVTIKFQPNETLFKKLHYCFPDLVSSCHSDWADDAVKEKCSMYMGRVYANVRNRSSQFTSEKYFKNVHCAICNFAEYKEGVLCQGTTLHSQWIPTASLTVVVDVNLSDGNNVGEKNSCTRGGRPDTFRKNCRDMSCRKPGYLIKNRKCVPP